MEIYENLYFKPELQTIIKYWYDKLVLHEKLRKAQQHLEKNFVRSYLNGNAFQSIHVSFETWRVGESDSGRAVNRYINYGMEMNAFFDIDKKNPKYFQWGGDFFNVRNLMIDELPKRFLY